MSIRHTPMGLLAESRFGGRWDCTLSLISHSHISLESLPLREEASSQWLQVSGFEAAGNPEPVTGCSRSLILRQPL